MTSKPMTSKEFLTLLDQWDIPHKPIHPEWATHNRNSKGPWGPVYGVGLHHTGSNDQTGMPAVLWDGRADLPGPLCHGGITKSGLLLLSGWGRTNHFGLGDSNVLEHVQKENYTGILKPHIADTDGNAHFYGFEIMYDGEHVMSADQANTAARLSAAICAWHKWTKRSVIGHGEWQPGKWDPGYQHGKMIDMNAMRNKIGLEMDKGPHPEARIHTVKAGDTPWNIAETELGDGKRWLEIVKLNPETVVLVAGEKLKLPEK